MSDTSIRERLGTIGVWSFTDGLPASDAAAFAQWIEQLGYSVLWLPDTIGRDPFAHIAFLGARTDRLAYATGIASIFHRHPGAMKQAALALGEQMPGRFVLGL